MERRRRLSDSKRLRAIDKGGRGRHNPTLGLKALPNQEGTSRYAFRVGKHIGKAVERNRVKRLMREAARSVAVPEGWDLIFSARGRAKGSNFWQVKRALEDILAKARLSLSPRDREEPQEWNAP